MKQKSICDLTFKYIGTLEEVKAHSSRHEINGGKMAIIWHERFLD